MEPLVTQGFCRFYECEFKTFLRLSKGNVRDKFKGTQYVNMRNTMSNTSEFENTTSDRYPLLF